MGHPMNGLLDEFADYRLLGKDNLYSTASMMQYISKKNSQKYIPGIIRKVW